MTEIKLKIDGIHCTSCKALIEEELEDIGATDIEVSVDTENNTGTVACSTEKPEPEIVDLIESLGDYTVRK